MFGKTKRTASYWKVGVLNILSLVLATHAYSQTPIQPIEPLWQTSVGHHNHTSRDEVQEALSDPDGNIIMVGSVERDSTFADIMVQKISPSGNLIWSYRYSSNYSLNYDRPIRTFLLRDNSIIVQGMVSNNYDLFGGGGYLFKLNTQGQLLWERKLYIELQANRSIASFFAALDSAETLHFAYTANMFSSKPSFFGTITRNNQASAITTIPNIFNANEYQPRPIGFSVTSNGNETFLISQPDAVTNQNRYYTCEITNNQAINHSIPLTAAQQSFIQRYGSHIKQDSAGSFYVLGNDGSGFILFKFLKDGQIGYTFSTPSTRQYETKDMLVKDSSILLTGRFKDLTDPFWRVFVLEIGNQGNIIQEKRMPMGTGNELVEGIYQSNGRLLLTIDYPSISKFTVTQLNPQLDKIWENAMRNPTIGIYQNATALMPTAQHAVFCGTLKAKKNSTNYFLSENDFYLDAFKLDTPSNHSIYRYSDLGTSLINLFKVTQSLKGTILVYHTEAFGPSYPALGSSYSAESRAYYTSLDTTGRVVGSQTVADGLGFRQAFADTDSTFIVITTFSMMKVDKYGNILRRSAFTTHSLYAYYVDTVHRQFYLTVDNDPGLVQFDFDFNYIQTLSFLQRRPILFQVKNDPSLYCYDFSLPLGSGRNAILFYKDGILQWRRDTVLAVYNSSDMQVVLQPFDKSLVVYSARKVVKFNSDGQILIKTTTTELNDRIIYIACMYDGNIILYGSANAEKLIQVFNTNLDIISRTTAFPDLNGTGYSIFTRGEFFFLSLNGKILVYNSRGERVVIFTHSLLTSSLKAEYFDDQYNFILPTTIGDAFFLGSGAANEAFGWRWNQGVIAKFSLSNLLVPFLTPTNEPIPANIDFKIKVYPNPVSQQLNLKMNVLNDLNELKSYNVLVYNLVGQMVSKTIWLDVHQDLSMDVANWNNGIFFIQVHSLDGTRKSTPMKIVKTTD